MTTIVWKDGIIAGDRQLSTEYVRRCEVDKITQIGEMIIGCAGDSAVIRKYLSYLSGKVRREPIFPGHGGLVSYTTFEPDCIKENINPSSLDELRAIVFHIGLHSMTFVESGEAIDLDLNLPFSIGSGSHFALGACAAGADAIRAVQIAARFDLYTGDKIDHIDTGWRPTHLA